MDTQTIIFGAAGLVALVVAVLLFRRSATVKKQAQQVKDFGVDGEATIIEKSVVVSRSTSTYSVTFQFDIVGADGNTQSYKRGQVVTNGHYQRLAEGTPVSIRYLPADPQGTAMLAGKDADRSGGESLSALAQGAVLAAIVLFGFAGYGIYQNTQTKNTAVSDFTTARTAIEPHLAQWEQVKDQTAHNVDHASLGLDGRTFSDAYYGYCTDETFYVYLPKGDPGVSTVGDTTFLVYDAYAYTAKPETCSPPGWTAKKQSDLGDGWSLMRVAIPQTS